MMGAFVVIKTVLMTPYICYNILRIEGRKEVPLMAYIELKPVRFGNFFGRKRFLNDTKIEDVLFQTKKMIAIKNTSDNFKLWSQPSVVRAMTKNRATFLIMSNRQLAFISYSILKRDFCLKNIKIYSSFQNRVVDLETFVSDDYEDCKLSEIVNLFERQIEEDVAEVYFQKKQRQIVIKANGVVGMSGFNNQVESDILSLICEAYNDSQK